MSNMPATKIPFKYGHLVIINRTLTKLQFKALCEDPDGLGLHTFTLLVGNYWQGSGVQSWAVPLDKQLEWTLEDCRRWLKKHKLPENSIRGEVIYYEHPFIY